MRILIIGMFLFISSLAYGQSETTAVKPPVEQPGDTVEISIDHQELLPQLLKDQEELQKALKQVNDNIYILLTGYAPKEKVRGGKVEVDPNGKIIIIK